MKKVLSIVAALTFIALVSSCVCISNSNTIKGKGDVVARAYDLDVFDELEVHSIYDVNLVQGEQYSVSVSTYENIFEYLDIKNVNGRLVLKLQNSVPLSLDKSIVVNVTMPTLKALQMSGSSDLVATGRFETPAMAIGLKGSSDCKGLVVATDACAIETSGSSDCVDLNVEAHECAISTSGCSEVKITLRADLVSLSSSGSSEVDLDGGCDIGTFNLIGASDVKAKNFTVQEAKFSLEGSADAIFRVIRELSYDISGSSDLDIYGDAEVVNESSSGKATIKFH